MSDMAAMFQGQKCSVCGNKAVVLVTDTEEQDPVYNPKNKAFYKKNKVTNHVFLCRAHDRKPVCKPRFKNEQEFVAWAREKGIPLQEFESEKEQQDWGKAQGVIGVASSETAKTA